MLDDESRPDPGPLDSLEVLVMCEDSVLYESPCLGQHGISLLVRARAGQVRRTILMDVGQDHEALMHNFRRLGVDPHEIDGVALTHCHYDHTRGLAKMLRAIGKQGLPVYAHPAVFRPNFVAGPPRIDVGMGPEDSAERLAEEGAELRLSTAPSSLMPGLFTTGEVPRMTDYEEVGVPGLSTESDGKAAPDAMLDDLSLVAVVRGRGPFVLTGCSHAGIVNIAKRACALCGTDRLAGIAGGLHLVQASRERIAKTCEGLRAFAPGTVAAGHCTGFGAQVELYRAFGEAFAPLATGLRIALGDVSGR